MRTKTLLLTAALSAAGVATSLAQGGAVYSVNAVGYVNTELKPGLNLVSNPLDNKAEGGNKIKNLFAGVPNNTQVYRYDSATGLYVITSYSSILNAWNPAANAEAEVKPGDGVFVRLPGTAPFTVTFVGDVMQGDLSTTIPAGLSIKSSQVPQTGTATQLNFPKANNDQIYKYDNATGRYSIHSYSQLLGIWNPSEPTINVGEAVFVRKAAQANWTRSFTVN